jgi:hypothetical protein
VWQVKSSNDGGSNGGGEIKKIKLCIVRPSETLEPSPRRRKRYGIRFVSLCALHSCFEKNIIILCEMWGVSRWCDAVQSGRKVQVFHRILLPQSSLQKIEVP